MFSNGRYCETDIGDEVNYVKLAEAYGIKGYKVTSTEELKRILKTAKTVRKSMLIDCVINNEEGVYPIVPPGKSIQELVLK